MAAKTFETQSERLQRKRELKEAKKERKRFQAQIDNTKDKFNSVRSIITESKSEVTAAIDTAQKRADVLLSSICAGGLIAIFQIFDKVGVGGANGLDGYEIKTMRVSAILFVICLLLNFLKSNISVLILSIYSKTLSKQRASIDKRLTEMFVTTKVKLPEDYVGKVGVRIIYWSSGLVLACLMVAVVLLGLALNSYVQTYLY